MVVHSGPGIFTRCGTDFICYLPYLIAFIGFGGLALIIFWLSYKIKSVQEEIQQFQAEIEELKDENARLKSSIGKNEATQQMLQNKSFLIHFRKNIIMTTDTMNTLTSTQIPLSPNTSKPKLRKLQKMFLTNYLGENVGKSATIQKKKLKKM